MQGNARQCKAKQCNAMQGNASQGPGARGPGGPGGRGPGGARPRVPVAPGEAAVGRGAGRAAARGAGPRGAGGGGPRAGGRGGGGGDAVEAAIARAWEAVGGEQPRFARRRGEGNGGYLQRVLEALLVPGLDDAGGWMRSPSSPGDAEPGGGAARLGVSGSASPSQSPRGHGEPDPGGAAGSPGSPRPGGSRRRPDPLWVPVQSRGSPRGLCSPQSSAGGSPKSRASAGTGAGSRRGSTAKLEGGVEERLRSEAMARFASRLNRKAEAHSQETRERVLRQKRETVLGTGVSRRRELGSATKEALGGQLRRAKGRSGLEREVEDPAGTSMRKPRSVVDIISSAKKSREEVAGGGSPASAQKKRGKETATVTAPRPPRSPSPPPSRGTPERRGGAATPRSNGGTPTSSPGDELAGKLRARKMRAEWPPSPQPVAGSSEEEQGATTSSPAGRKFPRGAAEPVANGRTGKGAGPPPATGPVPGSTSSARGSGRASAGRRESVKNAAFLEAAALFARAAGGPVETPVDKGWGLSGRRASSREGSPSP